MGGWLDTDGWEKRLGNCIGMARGFVYLSN